MFDVLCVFVVCALLLVCLDIVARFSSLFVVVVVVCCSLIVACCLLVFV